MFSEQAEKLKIQLKSKDIIKWELSKISFSCFLFTKTVKSET